VTNIRTTYSVKSGVKGDCRIPEVFHAPFCQGEVDVSECGDFLNRFEPIYEGDNLYIRIEEPECSNNTFCRVISQFMSINDSNCTVQIGTWYALTGDGARNTGNSLTFTVFASSRISHCWFRVY
jgi:hypothetical protein